MKYIKIKIELNRQGIEPLTAELSNVGINDIVVEDPLDLKDIMNQKNSYGWDYVDDSLLKVEEKNPKVVLYFPEDNNSNEQVDVVKSTVNDLKTKIKEGYFGRDIDFGPLTIACEGVDDENWKNKWKEFFKPTKISNSIVVKPTWEKYHKNSDEKIIEIDPGMAFGTGTHETTSLCIKMLEKYVKSGDKVLDVGCGSGILSIASALLGANDVLAVDIDDTAVEVAKDNVKLNNQSHIVKAQCGDLTKGINYKADVVVANLMADLVMILAESVANHLVKDGVFISSGILEEKEKVVSEAILNAGFEILEIARDGIWVAIVAKFKK